MSITVVTPATFAAVSTADMLSFLRLNDASEAALVASLVEAATDLFTNDTGGHVLCSQVLRLSLDHWPTDYRTNERPGYGSVYGYPYRYAYGNLYLPHQSAIVIPRGPVSSVSSVQYLDTAAAWQTLDPATYSVDTTSPAARVILPTSLPALHASQVPAVRVTFTAGYATAAAIPASALVGVRLLASFWYDVRTAFGETDLKATPAGWATMVGRYALGLTGEVNR